MKPVSWDEDEKKAPPPKKGLAGGGASRKNWLRPNKSAAAAGAGAGAGEVVAVEEMSDGEVDAAKEVERVHRKRLTELGMTPSGGLPDAPGATTATKTRGGGGGGGSGGSILFAALRLILTAVGERARVRHVNPTLTFYTPLNHQLSQLP